jgi:hypothetical protein
MYLCLQIIHLQIFIQINIVQLVYFYYIISHSTYIYISKMDEHLSLWTISTTTN